VLLALNSDLPAVSLFSLVGEELCTAVAGDCLITEADPAGQLHLQWRSPGAPAPLPVALAFAGGEPAARYGRYGGRYYASLPLTVSGSLAGGLHLLRSSRFSPALRRWLGCLCEQLSRWLERTTRVQHLAQQLGDLELALQSGSSGTAGMDRLLAGALRSMADALQADSCSLVLADRDTGQLIVDTAYGLSEKARRKSRLGEGIASFVIETGQPMLITDPRRDPRLAGLSFTPRPGIGSSICLPLGGDGSVAGVVSLNRGKGHAPFSAADLRLAVSLSGQLTPCVENAILYQHSALRLREMSTITQLTGALSATLDLESICRLACEGLTRLAGADACRLYLAAPELDPGVPEELAAPVQACLQDNRPVPVAGGTLLPVATRHAVVAVAQLTFGSDGKPPAPPLGVLRPVLDGAAVAIQNAVSHQSLRSHLLELNLVYQGLQRISASLKPDHVLSELAAASLELLGGQRALIGLYGARWLERPRLGLPPCCRLQWLRPENGVARVLADVSGALQVAPAHYPAVVNLLRDWQAPHAVLVPLRAPDFDLGVMVVPLAGPVPPARLGAVATLAGHAAAIIKQALDYQDAALQQSLEVSALYRLCEQISAAPTLESALNAVLDIVGSMMDFDQAAIYLWDPPAQLRLIASRGSDAAAEHADREVCTWVAREGKAFLSSTALAAPDRVSCMATVPLVIDQHCLGVLCVRSLSRPHPYAEEQVKLLSIIGSQAAAIYRALQSLGTLSRYTQNILESMVAGVVGLDNEGKIVMWSPTAERILDYPSSLASGRTLDQVMDEVARKQGPALGSLPLLVRRVTATGQALSTQALHLPSADGGRILAASCSPLRDEAGDHVGSVLLIEDVTEHRRMEERVTRMNQLAAVGHLAANIAHEIRNPISAIKTAAQFLSKEYRKEELIAQFAGIINEECDRLTKTTTDFLTFARPSSLQLHPASLGAVLERTLKLVGPELESQGITLDCRLEPLPEVMADPDELEQVFLNLLKNAIQAIEGPGRITVAASALPDGSLQVAVSDTGCGIQPDYLEEVFKPFFTTRTTGTGLGLAIVRKIVEAHGGRVTISSELARGATCLIVLPGPGQAPAPRPETPDHLDLDRRPLLGQLELFAGVE